VSINRRTAIAVRSIGVASAAAALALGVAGNAFACSITEFTPSAGCEDNHGVISVLDKDGSGTAVDITVLQGQTPVGTPLLGVKGSKRGVTFTIPVDWTPNTEYTVHVVKSGSHQEVGTKKVTTPGEACTPPEQGGTTGTTGETTNGGTTGTTTNGGTTGETTTGGTTGETTTGGTTGETTTGGTTGGDKTTAPAAPVDDTNAPKPAAGGQSNLAETGGGSNTGMIAGIAAALVVAGGGTVFFMRRRKPASHS
jgi:LPXTG-motif cell wall-anchored protein